MPVPKALEAALAALFSGIDTDDALAVLVALGLPVAYSPEAVALVDGKANEAADRCAALKEQEATRAERLAARLETDSFINARAFLYRLRSAQPGDIVAGPGPVTKE
jgi:hypothetical protein